MVRVVVVTGGAVVGGAVVGGAAVVGGVVVGGAFVTGTVVTGAEVVGDGPGTSVKMTPGSGTVVAGGGAVARMVVRVVDVVDGGGRCGEGATVLVVVEVSPKSSPGGTAAPVVPMPSTTTVEGVGRALVAGGRRVGVAWALAPEGSRARRAPTRVAEMIPTTRASMTLSCELLPMACHHSRSRPCACGRPKAAFLPIDEHQG